MAQLADTDDLKDLIALLRARGQRVTSQRLMILRELRRRERHAGAEAVHRAVHRALPGISIPTVYATLELLVELGLARKLMSGTGVSLFDARTEPHQHTMCRRCGRVDDVEGELDAARLLCAATDDGFRPDCAELTIWGLCEQCAQA